MSENQIEIISTNQREVELFEKKRKVDLAKLFTKKGIDEAIEFVKKETAEFKADITTKKGRDEIKSMAYKVSCCKSPIKNLAKELKEDHQNIIDGINSEFNRYEAAMDALRDEIRKPVDEIEEREAAELKARQDRLAEIERLSTTRAFNNVEDIRGLLKDLEIAFDFDNWGEFQFKAQSSYDEARKYLESEVEKGIKYETEQAELARLRKESAERAQKDREEQIAREAAEKAKREAEEAIERQKQEEEKKRLQLEEDARRAEAAKKAAEERAREAERLAKEQAELAEQKRLEAEKKAKEDAEKAAAKAVEDERERIRQEGELVRREQEKREANKKHRAKIEKEAIEGVFRVFKDKFEMSEKFAEEIVDSIAKGQVPHVTINY